MTLAHLLHAVTALMVGRTTNMIDLQALRPDLEVVDLVVMNITGIE